MRCFIWAVFLALVATGTIFLLSCSSGSNLATVNTSLSDPATCAAPQGPFSHIYVTVTDVQINQSASAGNNDPGWVDLTPSLKNNPVQVDLLGVANQCFLATLGSTGIQPGSYQQMRVILANNGVTVSGNKCGMMANCLMLTADLSATPQVLQLSSESQTGIKIPSGQIAGGQFVVAAGDNKDLNIDFNACASIVIQGSGQYRLKPVLHAGEVALQSTSTSISGTVIDNSTQRPLVGGNIVVALEQNQNGVDRVVMETVTNSDGTFSFCPVMPGTYDVVVSAYNASTVYAATVTTGVQPGDSLGNVLVFPVGAPASITGLVTTATGTGTASADLEISALLPITENGSAIQLTVPLAQQSAATATLPTLANVACPANTDCATYTLSVPAANPTLIAFASGGNLKPAVPTTTNVNYTVDATASIPGSGGQADCNPSDLQTTQTTGGSPLAATPNGSLTAATQQFGMCQSTN